MTISAFLTRCIIKLQKRQISTKIYFVDICPCLKHTTGLIFSSLVVKRSFIGVSMKISIDKYILGQIGITFKKAGRRHYLYDPSLLSHS
jgi:hypothetical protein